MFKTISLILCLLSFWLGQLTCDQLVTTVPTTVIPLTITVSLFGTATTNEFTIESCRQTDSISISYGIKEVSTIFIAEFLSTFPPQNVTIDIPTTTEIIPTTTTVEVKTYYNVVATTTTTRTLYPKPRNCDYDNSPSSFYQRRREIEIERRRRTSRKIDWHQRIQKLHRKTYCIQD